MNNVTHPESYRRTAGADARLDGWKSIAAYLRRDRTTVFRWARERGLPVHRLPGGRTGTVYALKHELDCWAGLPDTSLAAVVAPLPAMPPATHAAPVPSKPLHSSRQWLTALAVVGFAIGVPSLIVTRGAAVAEPATAVAPPPVLPADAATSAKFLAARDLVAGRKADGLERAIRLLQDVVREAPNYALGHAALAEALLLSREFGWRSDVEAFDQARRAARSAIRLDPNLATGHRMLGFLAYWSDQDFTEADALFRRALALAPNDAYSHFWYGNILSDHGDHVAGIKALNQARLLQPGSVAIATDLAWAHWAAGEDAAAKAALDVIIRDDPEFAVAYDCRAIIALAERDYAGYASNFARFAILKRDARLIENAQQLQKALAQGSAAGRREIMRQAMADMTRDSTRSHVWPALIASVEGDRADLTMILQAADRRNERWQNAGYRLRIERAWQDHPQILAMMARRKVQADTRT